MDKKQKVKNGNLDPRTYWAKERTFLAWIRTGLALMGFGFVVARFSLFLRMVQARGDALLPPAHSNISMWFGVLLILLGVCVQGGAARDYLRFIAQFRRGESPGPKPSFLGVGTALGLVLIGLVMAFYLIVNG